MKRYRIFSFDFDATAHWLVDPIREEWEEGIKEQHRKNRERIVEGLVAEYGAWESEAKRENFIALQDKPISILAFHNRFFEQIRNSFVMGGYYPALTAGCALGERILNHLILTLRDDFKATPEYKRVYNKPQIDKWDLAINTLESWEVLLPEVVREFRSLKNKRNAAIHFRPEVDRNDRDLALGTILCLRSIIGKQFSGFGPEPWFISDIPDEMYIKKDWEEKPFVRRIYLPNGYAVGPYHRIEGPYPQICINDNFEYEDREVTDGEFRDLRAKGYKPGPYDYFEGRDEVVDAADRGRITSREAGETGEI